MEFVNIGDAKANLSKLIEQALQGKEVIISKRNKPLVKLEPLQKSKLKKRQGGHWKGQVHMAKDFDELPQDILDAFNGLHP